MRGQCKVNLSIKLLINLELHACLQLLGVDLFTPSQPQVCRTVVGAKRNTNQIVHSYLLRVLSFNCKNIKTCGPFFYDVLKNVDIVMLQEHWLFK
jgi:hypothetical protein